MVRKSRTQEAKIADHIVFKVREERDVSSTHFFLLQFRTPA